MSKRKIREALEHAWQQREYPLRDSPHLITDFIMLAEELNRLRSYVCNHPPPPGTSLWRAYVSRQTKEAVFKDTEIFDGVPIVIDDGMTTRNEGGIHFPQPDGTCQRYNI